MSGLRKSQHLKIPLNEIEIATNNFETCIGRGGYGSVYKGELTISGKPIIVAVKRLNEQFGQGLKEFLTEIQLLSCRKHPNLISLVGYCEEGKEKMIVYEYAERGSLDKYLRSGSSGYSLTWLERLKICVDAARGLDYLHNHIGRDQTIIHRDIKSANILIDHNWVAKISDLGISKLSFTGSDGTTIITHACGTPGYCEPEYIISGIVQKESDVYSFGMVLFEVLCGRLCSIKHHDGMFLSATLAKDYYEKKKLVELIDPHLWEQMTLESMNKFSDIAYKCLHNVRGLRPSMDVVLKELAESLELQSFGRWMDEEMGEGREDSLVSTNDRNSLKTEKVETKVSSLSHHHMHLGGPSFANGKLFSIRDFAPDWAYSGTKTKVLIVGNFLGDNIHMSGMEWCCMFGQIEVAAEVLTENSIRCQVPFHGAGRVPFYITCKNRLVCSEVREFEYVQNPSSTLVTDSEDEFCLLVRLSKVLCSGTERQWLGCLVVNCEKCKLKDAFHSLIADKGKWWKRIMEVFKGNCKEILIQNMLKDKLYDRLLYEVHKECEGLRSLDEKGQGIIHLVSALGYDWAIHPVLSAGLSPNFRDACGRTALHWASLYGREETVVVLVTLGVFVGAVDHLTPSNQGGQTAAYLALIKGHKWIAGYLAEAEHTSMERFVKTCINFCYKEIPDAPCHIRTSMLSYNTMYAANLVLKFGTHGVDYQEYVMIKWKMGKLRVVSTHLAKLTIDGWLKLKLWLFINYKKYTDFEIVIEEISKSGNYHPWKFILQGIEFEPIEMKPERKLESVSMLNDDIDWEDKFPCDYEGLIQRSDKQLGSTTKKELYFLLTEGILLDNGKLWFSLCKLTGKKCHMVPAREIMTKYSRYKCLEWISLPESRFEEAAQIQVNTLVWVAYKPRSDMFSPCNFYSSYLVFKFVNDDLEHDDNYVWEVDHRLDGKHQCIPLIKPKEHDSSTEDTRGFEMPNKKAKEVVKRDDGWMEVTLCESTYGLEDCKLIKTTLSSTKMQVCGIIVQGIEFRPLQLGI